MKLFSSKSRYNLGMNKDNFEPIDLMEIYKRVQERKKKEQEQNES